MGWISTTNKTCGHRCIPCNLHSLVNSVSVDRKREDYDYSDDDLTFGKFYRNFNLSNQTEDEIRISYRALLIRRPRRAPSRPPPTAPPVSDLVNNWKISNKTLVPEFSWKFL